MCIFTPHVSHLTHLPRGSSHRGLSNGSECGASVAKDSDEDEAIMQRAGRLKLKLALSQLVPLPFLSCGEFDSCHCPSS